MNGDASSGPSPTATPRASIVNADAIAKAEAALQSLSTQFAAWLQDELVKLEAARENLHRYGVTPEGALTLYVCAHDLKGLGATYGYPLVSRVAASLCRSLDGPNGRSTTATPLIDAHVETIRALVRQDIRDPMDAVGVSLAEALEARVPTPV